MSSCHFDELVVPDFNRLCMPGAASFARKLHSKGVSLADWRLVKFDNDIVMLDCLLGADFYRRFISPHRLPQFTLSK